MSEVKVPDGWESVELIESSEYFTDGDWIEAQDLSKQGIRLIQTGNIGIGHFRDKGKKYITKETFTRLNCKSIYKNDILICDLMKNLGS